MRRLCDGHLGLHMRLPSWRALSLGIDARVAVQDSKRYNEWMNVVDYETPEAEEEHEAYKAELAAKGLTLAQFVARKRKASRQAAGGAGRGNLAEVCAASTLKTNVAFTMFSEHGSCCLSPSMFTLQDDTLLLMYARVVVLYSLMFDIAPACSAHASQHAHAMQQALLEVDPNYREVISEGVVRRHVLVPSKRIREGTTNSENLSCGQLPRFHDAADARHAMARVRAPPAATDAASCAGAPVATNTEPAAGDAAAAAPSDLGRAAAPQVYSIPAYAHWFRPCAVHHIERNANVEFFNGTSQRKTPEAYVEMRNWMVRRYRSKPKQRLGLLECRKHIVADFGAVQRVWRFLDSWGIINYEAQAAQVCICMMSWRQVAMLSVPSMMQAASDACCKIARPLRWSRNHTGRGYNRCSMKCRLQICI